MSLKFTIPEDSLPFDFLEKLNISFEEIFTISLKKKFPEFSKKDCEIIFESNIDSIHDMMSELKESELILDYCTGEEEIDESSGSWGYLQFEINDQNQVKSNLEIAIEQISTEIINTTLTNRI